ncbi:YusW family protein [Virgibacillus oceani]
MKKILLLTVMLTSPMVFTACGGEDESPVDDDTNPNEDMESQEALSTMNDMVNQMEELDYTMLDFDVYYADTEFEGKIKKDDNIIESEFYDPFNGEEERRGGAAFHALFPIVQDIQLDEEMTDEEAITISLEAFDIPDNFLRAQLQVIFNDGTERTFEVMEDESQVNHNNPNLDVAAMSMMNDMVNQMAELDYTMLDLDVYYADTEFEGKIKKDGNIIESEFYDSFNGQNERDSAAFVALFPIVEDLQLDAEMTDEEAIATSLEAFDIPDNYLKAKLQVIFNDGTEKNYEILQNEF